MTQAGGGENHYVQDILAEGFAPNTFALHDYNDVFNSADGCSTIGAPGCVVGDAQNFSSMLTSVYSSHGKTPPVQIYLTEQAVSLGANNSYLEGGPGTGSPPVQDSHAAIRQAQAAEGYLYIPHAATSIPISREYYFILQGSTPGLLGGDSATGLDDGSGTLGVPGVFRPSYCVLAVGVSPATAAGTPWCNDNTHPGNAGHPPYTDWDWDNPNSPFQAGM
jgi:hypothetical protein